MGTNHFALGVSISSVFQLVPLPGKAFATKNVLPFPCHVVMGGVVFENALGVCVCALQHAHDTLIDWRLRV